MSRPIQPSGTSTPSSCPASVSAAKRAAERRGPRAAATCRRAAQACGRRPRRPRRSYSDAPTSWPWAARNVNAIAPPIRITSARSQEALDDADLVGHLGAADDRRRTAASGRARMPRERLDLALQQAPAPRRQQVRDALGRGVRAVRRAERVVDVDVGAARPAPARARGRSLVSPAWKRMFSSSTTSPSRASRPRPAVGPRKLDDRRAEQLAQPRRPAPARLRVRHALRAARGATRGSAAAPALRSSPIVGSAARMRVSSRISPSSSGTLKSTRTSTRLPATSRSSSVRISSAGPSATRSTTRLE